MNDGALPIPRIDPASREVLLENDILIVGIAIPQRHYGAIERVATNPNIRGRGVPSSEKVSIEDSISSKIEVAQLGVAASEGVEVVPERIKEYVFPNPLLTDVVLKVDAVAMPAISR
jgi:hypothetical protein